MRETSVLSYLARGIRPYHTWILPSQDQSASLPGVKRCKQMYGYNLEDVLLLFLVVPLLIESFVYSYKYVFKYFRETPRSLDTTVCGYISSKSCTHTYISSVTLFC